VISFTMYDIVLTSRYKKSLRKIEKSGRCRISDIEKVVNVIASGKKFGAKHQDHSLAGDMSEYRECHIKNDLLLVYYLSSDKLILVLVDIGSHSDLF